MSKNDTNAEANLNVANLLIAQKAYQKAEKLIRMAIEIDPQYGEAWLQLGHILGLSERFSESEDAFRHAVSLLPDNPNAILKFAHVLRAQSKMEAATQIYQQAKNLYQAMIDAQPGQAEAHTALAEIHMIESDYHNAEKELRAAHSLMPNDLSIHMKLADSLFFQGKADEILSVSQSALQIAPDSALTNIKVAEALLLIGRPGEALQRVEYALTIDSHNIKAITLSATILERLGEPQKAYERLLPLLDSDDIDDVNIVLAFATVARHVQQVDRAIKILARFLDQGFISNNAVRQMLQFTLADLLDRKGSYDLAFKQYQAANALQEANFNPKRNGELIDRLIAVFSRDRFDDLPSADINSELPVFIVGMPRSGTTLVEQILSSHPGIYGAGELMHITKIVNALPQFLNTTEIYPECITGITRGIENSLANEHLNMLEALGNGARRVTDKMPTNFMFLGLIQVFFPGARIIHCQRDPLDTCLSCYFKNFVSPNAHAYNLNDLGIFYKNYLRLMEHWRSVLSIPIYEVKYEDLVNNQETVSRELVKFCGLEWDDACLHFHEHDRFAATASYDQVRRPMYKTSVGRWKNYAQHLQPLIKTLNG
jgi:tetratricopeptide (TPR) repeat protein